MKIKEVEKLVGMSSKNIRFYEEEGLLVIPRSNENQYREFDELSIQRLREIRLFRSLGVSLEDIRKYMHHEMDLQGMMEHRLKELDETGRNVQMMRSLCEELKQNEAPLVPYVVEKLSKHTIQKDDPNQIRPGKILYQMDRRRLKIRLFYSSMLPILIIFMLLHVSTVALFSDILFAFEKATQFSGNIAFLLLNFIIATILGVLVTFLHVMGRQQFFILCEHGVYYIDTQRKHTKWQLAKATYTGRMEGVYCFVSYDSIYKVKIGLRILGAASYNGAKYFAFVFHLITREDEHITLQCGLISEVQEGIELLADTLREKADVMVDPYHLMDCIKMDHEKCYVYLNKVYEHRRDKKLKDTHNLDSLWD